MMHINTNSIRQKLLNWLLILLIPSLLLGGVSAYYLANYFANLAYDRALYRTALALADEIALSAGKVVVDLSESALNLLEYDEDDDIYYQIKAPNHQVILGESALAPPLKKPKIGQPVYYEARFEDKSLRMVALNFSLQKLGSKDSATILVGETTAKRDKMAEEIIAIMLLPQIVLILLILFLVNLGIQRGLISLEKLKNLILTRDPADTHPIEEQSAPEELQPLVHAMNALLVKEKAAVDERRQFLANAAHQLKTPLAGLKIQAEAALRESNLAGMQHALRQISTGSDHLARLANQLLSLARAEPDNSQMQKFAPVDLVGLLTETTSDWVPKALEKHIDLGLNCTLPQCLISGSELLLQELINNLLDNAIRYNPAGTKVTASLELVNQEAVLAVQDNGVGIALGEQQKVFERFYRVLGNDESGCGLGLAIVREIVLQHHGRVELGYTDPQLAKGTTVKVIFSQ